MGIAYKNFWSLNTDEAIASGILRAETPKNIEVFMPLNAQMKDIDLVLINQINRKNITIQIKGSRAYEPKQSEKLKFGAGSAGWFFLDGNSIKKSSADYYMLLIYVLEEIKKTGRVIIVPHTIIIPTKKLIEMTETKKMVGKGRFSFFIWIDPVKKIAFDFQGEKGKVVYDLTEYLDKKGFDLIVESIN